MENEQKDDKEPGIIKSVIIDVRDSILFDLIINILFFIPRMLFRLIKNMW
jgi:hypothetical protein